MMNARLSFWGCLGAAVVLWLLVGCGGILHLNLDDGGYAELPAQHCMVFTEPQAVACESTGGRVAVGGKVVGMCHHPSGIDGPDRWMVIDTSGTVMTIIGGSCFTAVRGAR